MVVAPVRAVTANLACGGPTRSRHLSAADVWAAQAVESKIDLLFLQEVPSVEWLNRQFVSDRFAVYTPGSEVRSFRCRSAVVVRRPLESRPLAVPNSDYHGSYLAGAAVMLGPLGAVSCVSVHASPSMPKNADLERWTGEHPSARAGGGRDAGRRWDADYVLATLGQLATTRPTLAAGDFNECRGWDLTHPGETWGAEYFEAVEAKHLVDCLDNLWEDEVATRNGYQLDHVLATAGVASAVVDATVIDLPLGDTQHSPSDHRPVEFVIGIS